MQAQDYRMVRWAVLSRTKNASAETFRKAYDSGEIIRLHLLRGTWQLVSGKDYWWLLSLCASRAEAVIKGWMKSNKITIEDKELYSIREIFVRTAEAKGNVTKNPWLKKTSRWTTTGFHTTYACRNLAERCAAETFLPCRQPIPWQKTR